jgi:hypothetical protein
MRQAVPQSWSRAARLLLARILLPVGLASTPVLAGPPVVIDSIAKTERELVKLQLSDPTLILAAMLVRPGTVDLRSFHVDVPQTDHLRLCLRFVTIDGRYVAEPVYNLTGVEPRVHTLAFDSKFKSLLRVYGPDELVIGAWTAEHDCRRGPAGALLVTGWGEAGGARALRVFVNSGGSFTKVRLGACDAVAAPEIGSCERTESTRPRRVFDKACALNARFERGEITGCAVMLDFGEPIGSAPFQLRSSAP